MGHKEIFDKTSEQRKLWFMTNAQKDDLQIDTNNFYQIDLLKNILSGAKINNNAKFLSDIISENKNDFIVKNQQEILALNMTSFVRENIISENFTLDFNKDYLICYVNNEMFFVKQNQLIDNKYIVLSLDKSQKILKYEVFDNEDLANDNYGYSTIKIFVKNKKINLEWIRNSSIVYKENSVSNIALNGKQISDISLKIKDLIDEINCSKGIVENFINIKTEYLPDYLNEILKDNSKILLIACDDEGSVHFDKIFVGLKKFGLKKNLANKFRYAYLSAFSNNTIFFEKIEKEIELYKFFKINNNEVLMVSNGMNNKNHDVISHIIINGYDYSLHQRGLNIAIFDKNTNQVVDAFNVDACGDETLKINR
jgi:hypothetical protein